MATQNPELTKKFRGQPEFVENFFKYIAEEVREYMAELGFRTVDEMIGQVDRLETKKAVDHWKAHGLDFTNILYKPEPRPGDEIYCVNAQDHGLEKSLDMTRLVPLCKAALEDKKKVDIILPIKNTDRTTGTILGYNITKRYGSQGLPEDTVNVHFNGSAGMSFGAFVPKGVTMTLEAMPTTILVRACPVARLLFIHHATLPLSPKKIPWSVTSYSTAQPRARHTSAVSPVNASVYVTVVSIPLLKVSVTMVVNT